MGMKRKGALISTELVRLGRVDVGRLVSSCVKLDTDASRPDIPRDTAIA
jgi:hypothetical protein